MKHWKSTLLGTALAGADLFIEIAKSSMFDFSDWKNYLQPVLIAMFAYVVADAKKRHPL